MVRYKSAFLLLDYGFILLVLFFCALILLFFSTCQDGKNFCFASYYGDHMVLQKSPERSVLWGYGSPEGALVTVYLSGPTEHKSLPATVEKGIWRVTLDPIEAGGPYNVTAVLQNTSATLTDVLFGDVWLCGGQSNMYFKTSQIFNASEELAIASKYPHVRTFMVALKMSNTERTDLIGVSLPWSVPETSGLSEFSAVCWLFGRYMYKTLKYPIGLVESCWGGTPVEAWSSSRALQQCGLDWNDKGDNSVLWNAMIHPLLNMTLKGALWYQGERNTNYHQNKYNCSFPAMVNDWRMAFNLGSGGQTAMDFPFGFVQLSTNIKGSTDDGFPNIRWHQTADKGFVPNSHLQKTFMAVAMDLPDETSPYGTIHPRDKQDVAYRLTLGARAVAYNEKDVAFLGPFPKHILSNPMYVNITYDQAIAVKPSKDIFEICCSQSHAPCGFQSLWIPVSIVQWTITSILISAKVCKSTTEIAALRYAWKDWPCDFKACPVYGANTALPAPPFLINRYQVNGNTWNDTFRNVSKLSEM
ncbi:sialate O-acetylesterase-like isoform X1 [Corythoichthys intestinalis]|uniref:sialate O-acetylesterase-like isoform X1 n=2 Tax=Corythoichthys intestinalis TaxID=161448 RepID=UPI0025A54431|nr:sialate O-acetylesterase-like isoform X1 [Corythoichthys intestinalis]